MKHFINLTSRVINKLHIVEIIKKPSKYYVYMNNNEMEGAFLFSSGYVSTNLNVIEICEKEHKLDYKKITDWIEKMDK